ncbi:MAG TPA: thioredoxin family protein [Pirellulales bacterium]|jgi:thioredoxin-like negative regulator of GroEL|nr:thioredoxin family protein [Pirellulales bacterium]
MSTLALALALTLSALTTGEQTYEQAYNTAVNDSSRPLVVLVGADWCPACQAMKTSVLPQVKQLGGLNNVSFAMVNVDRDSTIAKSLMEGGSIPQLVMFVKTDKGWSRRQLTGNQSVSAVQGFVAQGVSSAHAAIATTVSDKH